MHCLYQDEQFIAVYKPAGMLVHRSRIAADGDKFLLQSVRDFAGRRVYPMHRLDRPTAGIVLFAFSSEVAGTMMPLFASGAVAKRYLALVRGYMPATGVVDHSLMPVIDPILGNAVSDRDKNKVQEARPAKTHFSCVETTEIDEPVGRYASARYSLVELRPEHGRRHQLRRHMKHIFHPILGDTTYGDGRHNVFIRQYAASHRLMLVATALKFRHPVTQAELRIETKPDPDFERVLDCLDLKYKTP